MMTNEIKPFSAASFLQFVNENRLMGSQCLECGSLHLPPRAICPKCFSNQIQWYEYKGNGHLAAFSIIYTQRNHTEGEKIPPYCTGIVELEEGTKISARILNLDVSQPKLIKIGTPLRLSKVNRKFPNHDLQGIAFEVGIRKK